MTITGQQLVDAAVKSLSLNITYDQEVCDVFVRKTIERAGGKYLSSAGANAMLRNLKWLLPLDDARANGSLQPGAVLFMVKPGWNSKYNDNLGSAEHIGIYTGIPNKEIIHSSESKGGVISSTFHRGHLWTHAGGMKEVDLDTFTFTDGSEYGGRGGDIVPDQKTLNKIILPESNRGQTVNMRKNPDPESIVYEKIRDGTELMAGSEFTKNGQRWKKVRYNSMDGYIMAQYLFESGESDEPQYIPAAPYPDQPANTPPSGDADYRLEQLEAWVKIILDETGIGKKHGGA